MPSPNGLVAVDAFAGIGGIALALQRAGVPTVAHIEIDAGARGVLADRFPGHALFDDIRGVTGDDLRSAGFLGRRGILAGGFPCQDLSVAGRRGGLAGARSGLFFELARLAEETKAQYLLLENVPGLLSSNGGRDMGTVVGTLADLGYRLAWRVLDAQFFGVPQRRRRVVIVASAGTGGASPGEILALTSSGGGHPPAGGEAGPEVAGTLGSRAGGSRSTDLDGHGAYVVGGGRPRDGRVLADTGVVTALSASFGDGGADLAHAQAGWPVPSAASQTGVGWWNDDATAGTTSALVSREYKNTHRLVETVKGDIAHTLTAEGHDATEDGTGRGTPIVTAFSEDQRAEVIESDVTRSLSAGGGKPGQGYPAIFSVTPASDQGADLNAVEVDTAPALTATAEAQSTDRGVRIVSENPIVFSSKDYGADAGDLSPTLRAMNFDGSHMNGGGQVAVAAETFVRRLSPTECERLQGFPDGWTATSNRAVQKDAPRYRQLGNAVAVPVFTWTARRLVAADLLSQEGNPS